ncbi:DUF5906 domain-containing protein [bacterium]|nr:DUF5906 domain-containing protein [bacterium]
MSGKRNVPYNDIGHWDHTSGENYLTKHHEWTDHYLEQASGLVGEDLVTAQHYARKLSTRFYLTSNLNGSTITREITGYGRAETVTPNRLRSYQRQIYGKIVEDELGEVGINDLLPVVNSSLYYPKAIALVAINQGVYFNTYQPPFYAPQRKVVKGMADYGLRPKVWQQFLKRWFPDDFSPALVLEGYIARLLHDPLNRPRWAMVFRSDQGTGKGFLTETLLPKLIGDKNINITSLDKIVGKFNGNQFSNKLIVLNETDNDRKGTYTKLKDKISDSVITVEEKYQNPVSQPLFNGTFVFSNEDHPLYADEDDRRFYVTPRLKHHVDREETQRFIATFASWLDVNYSLDDTTLTGWDIMAGWFAYVAEQKSFNEVNTYVVSKEGNRISDLTVKPQTADQEADLVAALDEDVNKKYLWRVADIREAYPYVKQALVEQLLMDAGYSHREKNNIKGDSARRAGWAWATYGSAQIKCEGIGHPNNLKPRVKG